MILQILNSFCPWISILATRFDNKICNKLHSVLPAMEIDHNKIEFRLQFLLLDNLVLVVAGHSLRLEAAVVFLMSQ